VIDAQELGKGAALGVALLGGEHSVSEAAMPAGKKLIEQRLMISVATSVY